MRLLCLGAELEGLPHELLVEALKLLEAQGKAQCVLACSLMPSCLACPPLLHGPRRSCRTEKG